MKATIESKLTREVTYVSGILLLTNQSLMTKYAQNATKYNAIVAQAFSDYF